MGLPEYRENGIFWAGAPVQTSLHLGLLEDTKISGFEHGKPKLSPIQSEGKDTTEKPADVLNLITVGRKSI